MSLGHQWNRATPNEKNIDLMNCFRSWQLKKIVHRASKDLNLVLSLANIRVAQMVPG